MKLKTIKYSNNIRINPEKWTIYHCLNFFKIDHKKVLFGSDFHGNDHAGYKKLVGFRCNGRKIGITDWPEGKLWDLYEAIQNKYYSRIKTIRPDLGNNHEESVMLNKAWSQTGKFFNKLG